MTDNKIKDIYEYSNPDKVKENIKKYFGKNLSLYLSYKPDKKYMLQSPDGKWVHFGAINYKDYTLHQDENRRQRFLKRNAKWSKAEKYSPAYLSYYLLWN